MSEPKTEKIELKKLRTDDLHKLKRGEIVVDENGKKYIVRKTLLPMHMGGGPANLGKFYELYLKVVCSLA